MFWTIGNMLLAPIAIIIISLLRKFNINKVKSRLLNFVLILIAFVYLILCLTLKLEPFNFSTNDATDYIINASVIFLFSPLLWIVLFHYCWQFFRNRRIHRNAKIKSDKSYMYYRDDLDKISPSIIMFVSMMDIETRTALAAVILKLKLMGYIEEIDDTLYVTNKSAAGLSASDKLVLNSIYTGTFNEKAYKELVKKEVLDKKYLKSNKKGKIFKLIKILITIVFPIIFMVFSFKLDIYVFENYRLYKQGNGVSYYRINDHKIVEKLYESDKIDMDDYYHSIGIINGEEWDFYDYRYIRADRLKYGIIRLAVFLNLLVPISILLTFVFYFVFLFKIIEQIVYFNKDYYRTVEGNKLLNRAYALKNYLKDFSLMKERSENELILWEYYLIYAVILDVNTKIKNEIMDKYSKNIILQ